MCMVDLNNRFTIGSDSGTAHKLVVLGHCSSKWAAYESCVNFCQP